MKVNFHSLLLLCIAMMLTACNTTARKENAGAGLAVGTAIGAATANPVLAVAGGAIGAGIGYSMNTNGKPPVGTTPKEPIAQKAAPVVHPALKPSVTAALNKKPISKRTILKSSPIVSFQDQTYCKQYRSVIDMNGKKEEKLGIACKQPSGKWRVMT